VRDLIPLLGLAVNLLGVAMYVRDMFRGSTIPLRLTWFLWTLPPLIATGVELHQGVTWAVIPVFASGFGPGLIFTASFFVKGSWKLTTWDYVCGFFSVLALVMWVATKNPALAVGLSITADGLAGLPTVRKLYRAPESETGWAFVTGFVSSASAFAAIRHWTFVETGFPTYLCVLTGLCAFLGLRKSFASKTTR